MEMRPPGRTFELSEPQMLMVFTVGGRQVATPAADVAGVRSCSVDVPIPSQTPFLRRLLRDGDQVLPVYDLAARLELGAIDSRLYIIARHRLGPLAVCIDGEMPTVHQAQPGQIRPSDSMEPDILGAYLCGAEAVPIYSLVNLGGHAGPATQRVSR